MPSVAQTQSAVANLAFTMLKAGGQASLVGQTLYLLNRPHDPRQAMRDAFQLNLQVLMAAATGKGLKLDLWL